MSVLWRKISKQVYLYIVLHRKTDGYKDFPASFGLCACGCKNKQNSWIWQGFFLLFLLLLQLLQLLQFFFIDLHP
ncbi:MAG: hypothetical protein K6A94_04990, partial [Bacteroidales bacterium]|nr:hypothetical protein [Bacteroidales bacterium]